MWRSALGGALWLTTLFIPVAGMMALTVGMPVAFAGWRRGFDAVADVPAAALLCGVMLGGYLVLALVGAIAGAVVHAVRGPAVESRKTVADLVAVYFAGWGVLVAVVNLVWLWQEPGGEWGAWLIGGNVLAWLSGMLLGWRAWNGKWIGGD